MSLTGPQVHSPVLVKNDACIGLPHEFIQIVFGNVKLHEILRLSLWMLVGPLSISPCIFAHAVEAVLDIAALGFNTGLIRSATVLLNESTFGDAVLDNDFADGNLSLGVASGEITPFQIASTYYEQVRLSDSCHPG